MSARCSVAVLISGSGSNLQAVIDACADGRIAADIGIVISNKAEAYGLERARQAGIATAVIDHRDYPDRDRFDAALMAEIDAHGIDLVVLAGFMRILTPGFTAHYAGRMLNIHPSLLPRHKGLHTHRAALEAGDAEHGASVHFVTADLDGGPVILQAAVPVLDGDDEDSLAARVLTREHVIYPTVVGWFAAGRLKLVDGRPELDGEALIHPRRLTTEHDEA